MYEHPYISHQVTRFEQEQIERAAERRRFLREHADQIVPRQPGPIRRMLRRIVGGGADAAPREALPAVPREAQSVRPGPRSGSMRAPKSATIDDCVGVGCEPVGATAR